MNYFVGNKAKYRISKWAKGRISETGVTRKQRTPNFPKNEHVLPSDTHTPSDTHMRVCVSQGKKWSFFRKFGMLCFLVTPVSEIRPFALLSTIYPLFVVSGSY